MFARFIHAVRDHFHCPATGRTTPPERAPRCGAADPNPRVGITRRDGSTQWFPRTDEGGVIREGRTTGDGSEKDPFVHSSSSHYDEQGRPVPYNPHGRRS